MRQLYYLRTTASRVHINLDGVAPLGQLKVRKHFLLTKQYFTAHSRSQHVRQFLIQKLLIFMTLKHTKLLNKVNDLPSHKEVQKTTSPISPDTPKYSLFLMATLKILKQYIYVN